MSFFFFFFKGTSLQCRQTSLCVDKSTKFNYLGVVEENQASSTLGEIQTTLTVLSRTHYTICGAQGKMKHGTRCSKVITMTSSARLCGTYRSNIQAARDSSFQTLEKFFPNQSHRGAHPMFK